MDSHKNFAYSTVATAPSPASSGTSLVVASGDGANFPTVPFNAVIWPANTRPLASNAEIVRVTAISTDTFTITRAQESSSARSVVVGDQIMAAITAKTLTDIEALPWNKTVDESGASFSNFTNVNGTTFSSDGTNITVSGASDGSQAKQNTQLGSAAPMVLEVELMFPSSGATAAGNGGLLMNWDGSSTTRASFIRLRYTGTSPSTTGLLCNVDQGNSENNNQSFHFNFDQWYKLRVVLSPTTAVCVYVDGVFQVQWVAVTNQQNKFSGISAQGNVKFRNFKRYELALPA